MIEPKPSPFCLAVIKLLKAARHQSMTAGELRRALIKQGHGKHPAAVAMHLTKLAWKQEFITGYCNDHGRVFMLTGAGSDVQT
jgi:hypothetical protein